MSRETMRRLCRCVKARAAMAPCVVAAFIGSLPSDAPAQRGPFESDTLITEPVRFEAVDLEGYEASLIGFSPDGLSFSFLRTRAGDRGNPVLHGMFYRDGVWQDAGAIPVPVDSVLYNGVLSRDGTTLVYNDHVETRMVRRSPSGWTRPSVLSEVYGHDFNGAYFCMLENATLYFFSDKLEGSGTGDIYRSRFVEGRYQKPENLGPPINTVDGIEFSPCAGSHEVFLIFTRAVEREDGSLAGESGFYFSRNEGTASEPVWSEPEKIERLPYGWGGAFSPDGGLFFFTMDDGIHYISTKALGLGL
jgi:hypothetical protein